MMTAGPAALIATLLPTNRPAPMMPPIVIMNTWRGRSARLRACSRAWSASKGMVITLPSLQFQIHAHRPRRTGARGALGQEYALGRHGGVPHDRRLHGLGAPALERVALRLTRSELR